MFSALLFGQTGGLCREVEQAARDSKEVCIYKTMHVFPTAYELTRLLNSFDPDVIFVELTEFQGAMVLAREIRVISPDTAVIGIASAWDGSRAEEAAAAGVLDVLRAPVTEDSVQQGLAQAIGRARPVVRDNLLAFLPAKAGAGATTVALNVAGCLAADQEQKVLVIEGDLRSGLISVLLKLNCEYSILDALENASLLDGTLWNRIVAKGHGLELLASPRPRSGARGSWAGYHQLLQFVLQRYDTIVADLPELVNEATTEIVHRARHVFIVTTPELPSLVLSRQRRLELRDRGVPDDRIGVIVNRWTEGEVKVEDLQPMLEAPVAAVFQNDYHCVRRAIQEGRLIGRKSELGRSFSAFAAKRATAQGRAPQSKYTLVNAAALVSG